VFMHEREPIQSPLIEVCEPRNDATFSLVLGTAILRLLRLLIRFHCDRILCNYKSKVIPFVLVLEIRICPMLSGKSLCLP